MDSKRKELPPGFKRRRLTKRQKRGGPLDLRGSRKGEKRGAAKGRAKGSPNRLTIRAVERAEAEAREGNEAPLDYMLRHMRDPTVSTERRDMFAIAAAKYCHPTLGKMIIQGTGGQPIIGRVERVVMRQELVPDWDAPMEAKAVEVTVDHHVGGDDD